jgi:hypothetical protein
MNWWRRLLAKLSGRSTGTHDADGSEDAPPAIAEENRLSQPASSMQADAPLEDEADDRLDRRPFAAAVADAIARRSDRSSIVIGIYGPWGDGKTTVLNWVRRRLDAPNTGVVVVPFNPWLIRDELSLLPAFFATLATALGRRIGGRTKDIAQSLERYGGVLSGISIGVPGASIDPGTTAQSIGKALGDRTLDDMKADFEKILREEGRRVLVIIDDVDRLDDSEIHAVFKLVKLAAAFEGINYLLAFDDDKVAAALANRYSYTSEGGTGHEGGYDFLEKIVQVPLRLPMARKVAVDRIALEGLQAALDDADIDLAEAESREFRLRYSQGLSPAITSLRTAKRFANAAGFALPLLKGEAYPIDVLSIEGINACYPTLYSAMRQHPSWFLLPYEFHLSHKEEELRSRQRERLERVLESVEPGLRDPAKELIQRVFPQTERLWTNFGSLDERDEWAEQQRVCSSDYFDRYFTYGVSATAIGDKELDDALLVAGRIGDRLADMIERKGDAAVDPLLTSLSRRVERLDPNQATALVDALITIGPRVSQDNAPRFGELNLEERTAALLAQCVLQVPDATERLRICERIVDTGQPLSFAAECLRWLHLKKSRTDDRRPLDEAAWKQLHDRLAARIVDYAEQLAGPLWLEERGIGLMYRARDGGQQEKIRRHAGKWLRHDPNAIGSLLKAVAGVAYGGSLGMAFQQDLTTDKYEGLQDVADLSEVRAAVIAVRGDAPAPTDFPTLRYDAHPDDVADQRVLEQFAWQDARAAQSQPSAANPIPPPEGSG